MAVATPACMQRLRRDYKMLQQNAPPFVTAHPDPENMLIWHYTVDGPSGSPYEGGLFHGRLVFPPDFPFQPPAVYMCTPNGRFKTSGKICLSMSDFHPTQWNPLWSVSSILTGLLSFMLEEQDTYGSVRCSPEQRRRYARESHAFNLANRVWCELFEKEAVLARERIATFRREEEERGETHIEPAEAGPPAAAPGESPWLRNGALVAVCVAVAYALYSI
eukprot:TRINITY_DN10698_c0_g1_i1.p1 TRINITY_DN10698_c0_g1~~TRINITY_DN10698_c0_g1_i1.p1  ORF type:complete len:242 (+),score=74.61 TRINITY_DN10698_c0_g1_i1:70-726(+)